MGVQISVIIPTLNEEKKISELIDFIKNEKVKSLKQRLDRIKSLSKDELKELYKNILNHQEFTQKGGVGLGLIDMAKRTEGNMEYKFTKYNEEYSFFNLEIYV